MARTLPLTADIPAPGSSAASLPFHPGCAGGSLVRPEVTIMDLQFLRPLYEGFGSYVSVYLDTSRDAEDPELAVDLRWRAARERLATLIGDALTPTTPRRPTRPSRGAKQRRLEAKHHRTDIKAGRARVKDDN